ncbi:hypothetical protein PORCRE_154 [Porphyromonas crevioricanis JCM 15906]|uniref:Uncharacterized protein n=1 Tax=Porphyromonas crevioricanis JCM 15906 TaxID=1305617 RepID=S4NB49_9PORP|nr:hypothetical protein PORCRE_154 [Porphyromonas crevioricanis JCM 15906]
MCFLLLCFSYSNWGYFDRFFPLFFDAHGRRFLLTREKRKFLS